MQTDTLFADILLPLSVKGTFTYRIQRNMQQHIKVGQRVVVQFGPKKIYSGLVRALHHNVPSHTPKYVLDILDEQAVVTPSQFIFWDWISAYYMAEIGEVMSAALPNALKLASETRISLHPDFIPDQDTCSDNEYLIIEALMLHSCISLEEASKILGYQKIMPLIKGMIEKNIVVLEEELKERVKPKKLSYIRLCEDYHKEEILRELFDTLQKKAFKQVEVLMAYLSMSNHHAEDKKEVVRPELAKKVENGTSAIATLIKKGILEVYEKEVSRFQNIEVSKQVEDIDFSPAQSKALEDIHKSFEEKQVTLLHGVTGSGKTEIYIQLIQDALSKNEQVLYLLPEIALTNQIIQRLQAYFGDLVSVYHSRFNPQERAEVWKKIISCNESNQARVVIGPRSALFLPFDNLGLIIVDEEHDNSYKQIDPSPRYHARDAAIYLGHLQKCKVLLGSATPSIESYYNARHKKYGLIELSERYGGIQLPEILVADLKREHKRKTMKSHYSSFLLSHIKEALNNKEQVILFQNRRGFSLRIECENCGWVPTCRSCDVSLIYHKGQNQLKCHYCGYVQRPPNRCPSCQSLEVKMKGFGTEKIEEELRIILPEAKIKRMDLDTTRGKHNLTNMINDFQNRKIDILVGTQMVTKGLDFDHVSIVGILNADNMLNFPDFRSYERAYQLMAQVSGRAGRKKKRGKVIIQSFNPWHAAIRDVMNNDYMSMYQSQILERRNFYYPPFYRLIEIKLKHKDNEKLFHGANAIAKRLKTLLPGMVLGPEYPMIPKLRDYYIKQILIKLERNKQLGDTKKEIARIIEEFKGTSDFRSIRVQINVDPQ